MNDHATARTRPMKVLLCGAAGFVGRRVRERLAAAGHEVLPAVSARHVADADAVRVDFARDLAPADWLPRLAGIDAVVNTVGVLRDSAARPMQAIHAGAPIALFEACAAAGVRRVVHVSALGIEHSGTRYAGTKRQADERLLALGAEGRLDALVLRPSIVFGTGGASSALFLAMSKLPLLVLPRAARQARIQPLHVDDLAQAIARALSAEPRPCGLMDLGGPDALTLADFIAALRRQAGRRAAQVLTLPEPLTRWSARMGDACPLTPWGRETLALLGQGNVAAVNALPGLLGRAPRSLTGAPHAA